MNCDFEHLKHSSMNVQILRDVTSVRAIDPDCLHTQPHVSTERQSTFSSIDPVPTLPRHMPHTNLPHAIHNPILHHTLVIISGKNSMLTGI